MKFLAILNSFSASLHEAAICSIHKAVNREILVHAIIKSLRVLWRSHSVNLSGHSERTCGSLYLGHVPLGSTCRPSLPCYTDSSRVPTYRKPLAGGGRLERYNKGISRVMSTGKE